MEHGKESAQVTCSQLNCSCAPNLQQNNLVFSQTREESGLKQLQPWFNNNNMYYNCQPSMQAKF